jgi:hypothetical protein
VYRIAAKFANGISPKKSVASAYRLVGKPEFSSHKRASFSVRNFIHPFLAMGSGYCPAGPERPGYALGPD